MEKMGYLIVELKTGYVDGWYCFEELARNQSDALAKDYPKGRFIVAQLMYSPAETTMPYSAFARIDEFDKKYKALP